MRILLILFFFAGSVLVVFGETCLETAQIVSPLIGEETKKIYESKLGEAESIYKHRGDADAVIWYGRRIAYLGDYKKAINIFSKGIEKYPQDARLYRHRGHRFITIRCFSQAVRDFEQAAKLVKGKKDEIEPDGLPNARNIPTSTLQSNIFYHLGLAHYLRGNFKKALEAYQKCEKVSKNNDMLVATKHWLYMTLRRLGKVKEAQRSIAGVKDDLDIIENDDYYKLIKLYQGKLTPEQFRTENADSLGSASTGYGVGNWFFYNGKKDEAKEVFKQIVSGNQWASFGYIAAEFELKNN